MNCANILRFTKIVYFVLCITILIPALLYRNNTSDELCEHLTFYKIVYHVLYITILVPAYIERRISATYFQMCEFSTCSSVFKPSDICFSLLVIFVAEKNFKPRKEIWKLSQKSGCKLH